MKGIRAFFRDERVKITFGLFIIGFGLFLLVAFISYFFTWKADQSFDYSGLLSGSDVKVENWSGKTGARLANVFMNRWIGIPSLVLPVLLILCGIRLLGVHVRRLGKLIIISLTGALLLSITLGYLSGNQAQYLGSGSGGAHGYFISRWLNSFIGLTGSGILLLVLNLTFLFFTVPASFILFKKHVIERAKNIKKDSVTAKKTNQEKNKTGALVVENVNEFKIKHEEDISREITGNSVDLVLETTPSHLEEINNDAEEIIGKQSFEAEEELQIENFQTNGIIQDDENDFPEGFRNLPPYDPKADLSGYKFPSVNLLDEHKSENSDVSNEELIRNKDKIVETLGNYKIPIDKIKATIGPTITLYEIVPAAGVRISRIKNLEDDIALNLSALGIRIIAPIPGRGTIGIEVPNQKPEIVSMKSILVSKKFQESTYDLPIALGKTISNETFILDLAKMPHLLVAGATGQGKSVGLNAVITSLIYKKHPAEIKFVLIDPKKVELTPYVKIERHFLAKLENTEEAIITDTQKVINTLQSLTKEMEKRYDLLKKAHVRNIKEYNSKFIERKLNPNKGHEFLPYIVVIIDEFADLIMTAGREVETPLARLAQLARAIGIHLVIATQRPTTNIITGVIKANFPARIAFRVSSMIDSRTILDTPGANQLIGRGDMLVSTGGDLIRVQCAFIDTSETDKITDFIGSQRGYLQAFELPEYNPEGTNGPAEVDLKKKDELFEEAARLVVIHQQGSTSLIQRKFSIGYNRAGRIVDQLEAAGIVGPFEGSKARQVLIQDELSLERILNGIDKF
jgi:DNA segregation ATPase FtsK/SpoIIIE, S-DNA-T family